MRLLNVSASAVTALALGACGAPSPSIGSSQSDLRSISTDEALADFDQIAQSFRALYGCIDRKEQKYGFDFESMVKEYRARLWASESEAEAIGIFQEFISRFHDAHVSLPIELQSDDSHQYRLPFDAMPIEDTFVVYSSTIDGIARGDELISIDGVAAGDLVASFLKYVGTANPLASAHMAAAKLTNRPVYLSQNIVPGSSATVHVRGPGGTERVVQAPWSEIPSALPTRVTPPQVGQSTQATVMSYAAGLADVIEGEFSKEGARVPFFMSDAARAALGITEVTPSAAELAKVELAADDAAKVNYFAGTYSLGGKKVLLLRIPTYLPDDMISSLKYIAAVLDEQQPMVDAMVFDETHNPGGSNLFANGIMSMLTTRRLNANVEEVHADRKWIQSYVDAANGQAADVAAAFNQDAQTIDDAYSAGEPRSAPIPLFEPTTFIDPSTNVQWGKPFVVLADELSVSNADIVPNVIKRNNLAPIFGYRTMGGGGNVEVAATLDNTQGQLHLSRGLFTVYDPTGVYPASSFIEDNGVLPDVPYSHTLTDFRAGYLGYVAAFNAVVAQLLAK